MSRQALVEYITGLLVLYKSAGKEERTLLLDHAVRVSGKSRRSILRYLKRAGDPQITGLRVRIEGRGRPSEYNPELLLPHIRILWKNMEMISAERMVEALPKWLPHYRGPEVTPQVLTLLEAMSRSTLERMLVTLRQESVAKRGLSTTSGGTRAFKLRIPINTLDREVTQPGYTQVDTVAHCGTTTAGAYINTLTLTDIFSGWTENRSLESKRAVLVRRALVDIKRTVPFRLIGINSDSGSEFINHEVLNLMNPNPGIYNKDSIIFTRSRPYKKNDNCYVEQRNYTHVRQLFGYSRYESPGLVKLMNEIYVDYWNPLHNYFLPSQKLVEKSRVGAKIVKKHDVPQTPCDRLLAHNALSPEQKTKLRETASALNPFELAKGLEQKLKAFHELHRKAQAHKEAA